MKTRIVFMGSPPFAVPTLQALSKNYPLVGVVTQPDRPAGRGRSMRAPAVKVLAQALEIPIIQPQRVRDQHARGVGMGPGDANRSAGLHQ